MIGFHSGASNWTQEETNQKLADLLKSFEVAIMVAAIVIVILTIEKIYIKYKNKNN